MTYTFGFRRIPDDWPTVPATEDAPASCLPVRKRNPLVSYPAAGSCCSHRDGGFWTITGAAKAVADRCIRHRLANRAVYQIPASDRQAGQSPLGRTMA